MDWTEKIKKAMVDLSNACKENQNMNECLKCPFFDICDMGNFDVPEFWFEDEKNNEFNI